MKALAFVCCFAALAVQAQVYKWVDDKGQVHYSETPPPQDATQLKVPTGGPASAPAATPEAKPDTAQAPATGTPEAKAKRCDFEKQQLKVLEGAVVTYKNEKGEYVKMDDAKRESSRKLIEDNIKRYCS